MTREADRRELDRLLHQLWSKAVGTPDYHKPEWKRLAELLDVFAGPPPLPRRETIPTRESLPAKTAWEIITSSADD